MNQNIDYHSKYLKYKKKYLRLKSDIEGGANELSWKNEPKFVPKFNDNTQKDDELRIFEDNKVIKYKWQDEEAKDIMSLRSGIINQNSEEVINSLFKEFISKIFNYENVDSETFSLFKIKYVANNDNCSIELQLKLKNKQQRGGRVGALIPRRSSSSPKSKVHHSDGKGIEGFAESLGWGKIDYKNPLDDNNGLRGKNPDPEIFSSYWLFVNEKTGVKEYFNESKHFKDGFFGKVKKGTIDGIEINLKDFGRGYKADNMDYVLRDYTGMINVPNSYNCTEFLKTFYNFWNGIHLFYKSLLKK